MSTEFFNDQWRMPSNENQNKVSNYSMEFDETNKIQFGNVNSFERTDSFSGCIWVNLDSVGSEFLLSKMIPSTPFTGYLLYISNSKLVFNLNRSYSTNYIQVNSVGTISSGSWNHLAFTYDGSSLRTGIKLYINGIEQSVTGVGPASVSGSTITTTAFQISGRANSSLINGKIDQASIFDYALSASQVSTLYGGGTAITNPMSLSPKPIAYYQLGDQSLDNGANYLVPNNSLSDYVFDFDPSGSGDYISFGNSNDLKPTSNYTFSIWFKGNPNSYALFGTNSSTSSGVHALYTGSDKLLYYHRESTGTIPVIQFSGVVAGAWNNFTITWSASTGILRGFLNGKYQDQRLLIDDIVWGNELEVGRYNGGAFKYNGKISNFAMWNTTLTDGFSGTPTSQDVAGGQVAEVYNNGSPQTTITGSPVGWWKLDASATYNSSTTTWTIPDSSSNSNDGTSSGMTQANLVQSDLSFTSGYSPYALEFAADDLIDCGTNPFDETTGNMTLSAWVKKTSGTGYQPIVAATQGGAGTSTYFSFQFSGTNSLSIFWDGVGGSNLYVVPSSEFTVVNGNWYLINFVRTGTVGTIYVNGNLISTSNKTYNNFSFADRPDITLGGWNFSTSARLNGELSNVSLWNAALTSAQITEVYNEGVPSNLNNHSAYSNLISWWQLGSNSSFNTDWTVLNEKGSNNGTSQNMTNDDIVDGPGYSANGLGTSSIDILGYAPYSTSNGLSKNMDVLDRITDVPS